jgi:hypothetical protein
VRKGRLVPANERNVVTKLLPLIGRGSVPGIGNVVGVDRHQNRYVFGFGDGWQVLLRRFAAEGRLLGQVSMSSRASNGASLRGDKYRIMPDGSLLKATMDSTGLSVTRHAFFATDMRPRTGRKN